MEESKDLKAGMTTRYKIGEQEIVLKPVTLGKMKKSMTAFTSTNRDTFDMMIDYLVVMLDNGANDFATREWIENNVTLPVASAIITDSRVINGLEKNDFLKPGAANAAEKETRDLSEKKPTPSV